MCSWASCRRPAVTSEGGDNLGPWWHCADHLRAHRAHQAEETARPCAVCAEPFTGGTARRTLCDDCRASRKHKRPEPQPCGTRAAHERHLAASETPCDACVAARATYYRTRYEQRKSA